jgi:hypothetical protein
MEYSGTDCEFSDGHDSALMHWIPADVSCPYPLLIGEDPLISAVGMPLVRIVTPFPRPRLLGSVPTDAPRVLSHIRPRFKRRLPPLSVPPLEPGISA